MPCRIQISTHCFPDGKGFILKTLVLITSRKSLLLSTTKTIEMSDIFDKDALDRIIRSDGDDEAWQEGDDDGEDHGKSRLFFFALCRAHVLTCLFLALLSLFFSKILIHDPRRREQASSQLIISQMRRTLNT